MKFCPNCGSEVQDGASFCTSCGGKLPQDESLNQENSGDSIFGFEDQSTNSNPTYNNQNTYQNQTTNQNQNNAQVEPQKTNSMCLVGFILSFFFSLIGIIVSCVGLSQLKKNPNEKGKGMAIAGIVIGSVGLVFQIIVGIIRGLAIVAEQLGQ